jgi:hypothetical protein
MLVSTLITDGLQRRTLARLGNEGGQINIEFSERIMKLLIQAESSSKSKATGRLAFGDITARIDVAHKRITL